MTQKQQRIFLLTTALFWFALYTYPVLLGNYLADALGAGPAMVGLVVGSYGFSQMALRLPLGFASDKLRRRGPFLLLGTASALLAALGLYLSKSPASALLARGMAGVAASSWVCFTVLYSSAHAPGQRASAMGTLSSIMYAAQLTATLLGGALARAAGVRSSFLLAILAGVAALALSLCVEDRPPKESVISLRSVGAVLRNRLLLHCALVSVLLQMISWSTLYGFSPSWAERMLGADSAQLGLLPTAHLIPTILFSKLAPARITPKLGEKATLALGFALMALGCALVPFTRGFQQMLALQVLCGMGTGCTAPLLLAACTRDIPPERQAIAMGAYQSLYGIGMFTGPLLSGWLVQASGGYPAVFWAAAAAALIGGGLSLGLPRGTASGGPLS